MTSPDTFTGEQWRAAIARLGRFFQSVRNTSPDDYAPAPSSTCDCGITHGRPAEYDAPASREGKGLRDRLAERNRQLQETDAIAMRLRSERDQASRIAVELENQLAAVRGLHSAMKRGGLTICAHCSGWDGRRCRGAVTPWPCDTTGAITPAELVPAEDTQ